MSDFNTSKVNGDTVSASEWNQLAGIDNAITSSGQTPSSSDLQQLGKSMSAYAAQGGIYATDSGAADAYVLTQISPFQAPPALKEGLTIKFIPGNANTGACTVNAFGLGVKDVKLIDGTTNPGAGALATDSFAELVYNGTSWVISRAVSSYGLGSTQTFTSSGTWSKPSGCRAIRVILVGGGAGGGAGGTATGGGGAGGYAESLITSVSGSIAVTIGGGGSPGVSGGTTSFGTLLSATGGSPGGTWHGGLGGLGVGGNVTNDKGSPGHHSMPYGATGDSGGEGGSTIFGGAGRGNNTSLADAGIHAQANSGSGGGGKSWDGGSAVGNGGSGKVIVYEYY